MLELIVTGIMRSDRGRHPQGRATLSAAARHALHLSRRRQSLGVLPGVEAPTGKIETPAALALIVFFAVHYLRRPRARAAAAISRASPSPSSIMLPLNLVSEVTRTFSLMVRLFGNVMSGEFVIALVVALAGLFVPIPLMALEILVGAGAGLHLHRSRHRLHRRRGRQRRARLKEVPWTIKLISIIAAAIAVSIGSIGPALAEGRSVAAAMDAIARQPEAAGTISRTLFVGLAMIETMAIYCLVVALLLLFANPYAG